MNLESLLWLVPILLDVGNIIFTISNGPQMWTAYKNRKSGLKGLSSKMLLGYVLATLLFCVSGLIVFAPFMFILTIANIIFYICQFYWKRKYRRNK